MQSTPQIIVWGDASKLKERYLEALLSGAFAPASQIIKTALQTRIPAEVIYDQVFAEAMNEVGHRWEIGKVTIAEQHLASGITEYCRNLVLQFYSFNQTTPVGRVLLTSVEGNQHSLGLNLLSDIFRWQGWEVFPFFPALPEEEIVRTVKLYQVDLVCLSVALKSQASKVAKIVHLLRQSGWSGLIEVGGAAIINNSGLVQEIGADFGGGSAMETVTQATQLLKVRS